MANGYKYKLIPNIHRYWLNNGTCLFAASWTRYHRNCSLQIWNIHVQDPANFGRSPSLPHINHYVFTKSCSSIAPFFAILIFLTIACYSSMYSTCPFAIHHTISLSYSEYCQPDWFQIKLLTCTPTETRQISINSTKLSVHTDRQRWSGKVFSSEEIKSKSDKDKKHVNLSRALQKAYIGLWKQMEEACTHLLSEFANRHDVTSAHHPGHLPRRQKSSWSLFCACTIQKIDTSRFEPNY